MYVTTESYDVNQDGFYLRPTKRPGRQNRKEKSSGLWLLKLLQLHKGIIVGTTTMMLPLLTMHMLYDVRCGTVV